MKTINELRNNVYYCLESKSNIWVMGEIEEGKVQLYLHNEQDEITNNLGFIYYDDKNLMEFKMDSSLAGKDNKDVANKLVDVLGLIYKYVFAYNSIILSGNYVD